MPDSKTELTVTIGDLLDFCCLINSADRWEHYTKLVIAAGLKEIEEPDA